MSKAGDKEKDPLEDGVKCVYTEEVGRGVEELR